MPVMAIAAVGSMALGAVQARKGAKGAKAAQAAQDAARREQMGMAKEQIGYGRNIFEGWQRDYMPMLGDMKDMAYEEQRPDYAAISSDVGSAFDASRGINSRNMQRMGVKPTDGAAAAAESAYGMGRAATLVGARNSARMAMRDQRFNRMGQVFGMSQGVANMGVGMMGQGYGAAANAASGQAADAGVRLSGAQAQQSAGMGAIGSGLGMMAGGMSGGFGGGGSAPSGGGGTYGVLAANGGYGAGRSPWSVPQYGPGG